ncbi:MAG: metalloregulator ArsR/SmtB family transcription factor [Candidatus Izimaplasma sp.]|nr:metalloregulator ArsR/SmtB family transcription factor [Candidatus Izimaplasma bacterium]
MKKHDILKLLSDQTRYDIFMKLLEYDSLVVSEIQELLNIKQANCSKHLKKLKIFNVVKSKREKNMVRYSIRDDFLDNHEYLIRYLLL